MGLVNITFMTHDCYWWLLAKYPEYGNNGPTWGCVCYAICPWRDLLEEEQVMYDLVIELVRVSTMKRHGSIVAVYTVIGLTGVIGKCHHLTFQ